MTPDEILSALKQQGIRICRKTLYNYEKRGLISPAYFRNSRTAEYHTEVVQQIADVYRLYNDPEYWRERALKAEAELNRLSRFRSSSRPGANDPPPLGSRPMRSK